ncbi:MAG TPA: phosphate ABC transporter, permease protein PstA, partial [Gammaproteobacteria bacterium]|nr:phosphate ABC transporter, permease protein PstA [Gammaproteobacteria bacterium]
MQKNILSQDNYKNTEKVRAGLKKRYAREKRFRFYGFISILISFLFLLILVVNITGKGLPAFQQTYVKLDIKIDSQVLGVDKDSDKEALFSANYGKLIKGTL